MEPRQAAGYSWRVSGVMIVAARIAREAHPTGTERLLINPSMYLDQCRRVAHPSIRRPLAAIQLPATRTAIRVHEARSLTTNAATRATITKIAKTSPRRTTAGESDCPIPVPLRYPWYR